MYQKTEQFYRMLTQVSQENILINQVIKQAEDEEKDLLHELELTSFNVSEGYKLAKRLQEVRQRRRELKNHAFILRRIKEFTKDMDVKLEKLLQTIRDTKEQQKNAKYIPRVLTDLKCGNISENLPKEEIKVESPTEFLLLSLAQKTDRLAKLYIAKCTTIECFVFNPKKKRFTPCGDYYAIRKVLSKADPVQLVKLYSFLCSFDKEYMNLTESFVRSEQWDQQQKLESDREKIKELEVKNYDSLEDILRKDFGIEF